MAELPISEGMKGIVAAHAATAGWAIEIGILPPTPDKVIAIADTGGLEANPKWLLDYPSVQITVRGVVGGYIAAFVEAKILKDLLLGLPSQDINGDRWANVNLGSDVQFIGKDDNSRPLFTVNFRLIIEPQSTSNTNRLPL